MNKQVLTAWNGAFIVLVCVIRVASPVYWSFGRVPLSPTAQTAWLCLIGHGSANCNKQYYQQISTMHLNRLQWYPILDAEWVKKTRTHNLSTVQVTAFGRRGARKMDWSQTVRLDLRHSFLFASTSRQFVCQHNTLLFLLFGRACRGWKPKGLCLCAHRLFFCTHSCWKLQRTGPKQQFTIAT